jgi:ferric-dicitrate binding protein FerR (iron transport regulator)
MKPESLQALLMDRELGELSAEATELLEAWLADHPAAAAAAPNTHQLHGAVRTVFARFPELARPTPAVRRLFPRRRGWWVPVALAASFLALLAGTSWVGFRLGQASTQPTVALSPREPSPAVAAATPASWATYALVSNPRGGLNVVRRSP